jgi:hypothetical protein
MPKTATDARLGAALLVLALLSIGVMTHHPVADGHGAAGIARVAGLSQFVHGVLVALLFAGLLLVDEFTRRRMPDGALRRAGRTLYGAGTIALAGAGLVNGFVVPWLAVRYADGSAAEALDVALHLAGYINRALANAGVIGWSAGIAAWSLGLWSAGGRARVLGGYGLLGAAVLVPLLLFGVLRLNVMGMLAAVAVVVIWQAGAGLLLRSSDRGRASA